MKDGQLQPFATHCWTTQGRGATPWVIALLAVVAVLLLPTTASAHCCSPSVTSSNGCNIFGCNCSGPCTNFGYTCKNGPIKYGDACGSCPGYDTCVTSSGKCGYCTDPRHCCDNDTACCVSQSDSTAVPFHVAPSAEASDPSARFKAIDTDRSGGISPEEAAAWLRENKPDLSKSDFRAGFHEIDRDKSGSIEPKEFDADSYR